MAGIFSQYLTFIQTHENLEGSDEKEIFDKAKHTNIVATLL